MTQSLVEQLTDLIEDRDRLPDEPRPPNSYISKSSAEDDIGDWAIRNADEILARLRLVDALVNGKRYIHNKRGSTYTTIASGMLQTSVPIGDNTKLVSYLDNGGTFWFRPVTEFEDGRFQEVNHE